MMLRSTPSRVAATFLLTVLVAAGSAHAAFSEADCFAAKRKNWGDRRHCEANQEAKQMRGKRFDFAKCKTKFDETLVKIIRKAIKANVLGCRFRAEGGTVTDFQTGLEWEQKSGGVTLPGGPLGLCLFPGDGHCVNEKYTWNDAWAFISGTTDFGSSVDGVFTGDGWRLPTVVELNVIRDENQNCSASVPCIDPIFGPTVPDFYWTSTTNESDPTFARFLGFEGPSFGIGLKAGFEAYVRAVRNRF
jgi:hypothetical protein